MKHFHTHRKYLLCVFLSFTFMLTWRITLTLKCHFLVVFCTPVNSWNKSFYCDSDVHISLSNISSWKSIYKSRDLTMPWCTKIKFWTTCGKFGKFQNHDWTLFCSFFLNQIRFKCPMNTKLGLLCLRPSLNGLNVTHIRRYSIIAVYVTTYLTLLTPLYRVWCPMPSFQISIRSIRICRKILQNGQTTQTSNVKTARLLWVH